MPNAAESNSFGVGGEDLLPSTVGNRPHWFDFYQTFPGQLLPSVKIQDNLAPILTFEIEYVFGTPVASLVGNSRLGSSIKEDQRLFKRQNMSQLKELENA